MFLYIVRIVEEMNKKIIVGFVVVVITVVIVAIFAFQDLVNPPVDFSGVNPSTSLTTADLLPQTLTDILLIQRSVYTEEIVVDMGTLFFIVELTSAQYDGIAVYIFKAQNETLALETLKVLFEDNNWYGGASSYIQTDNWFTVNKGGRNVFFWQINVWIFGIDAESEDIRNDAANDLVQYLRDL